MISISGAWHDVNFFDGKYYTAIERISKIKHHEIEYNKPEYFKDIKNIDNTILLSGMYKADENKYTLYPFNTPLNKAFLNACFHKTPITFQDYTFANNLYYIDHHIAHAAQSFYNSGYKQADIIVLDGQGSHFRTIFIDKNFKTYDLTSVLSIGKLWGRLARYITNKSWSASRLMGLVGYSNIEKNSKKYKELYNFIDYLHNKIIMDFTREQIIDVIINKMNNIYGDSILKYSDLAYVLQQYTINKIHEHIKPLRTSTNICVSGGTAYNGYLNESLYGLYDSVYVPFAPGDEGLSLGLYMHYNKMVNDKVEPMSPYLGREYDTTSTRRYKSPKEIAKMLSENKIIALFQGRSEAGHRALGNRSILANPMNKSVKDIINHDIKFREDFRPFAPVVLEDKYQEWFCTKEPSKYMNRIVKSKQPNVVPGITHVDGTSRIQTLEYTDNKFLYEIISEFDKITGVPMLLNTSFNCQEPIVETPEDAIKTFNKTKLDDLIIL